MITDGDSGIGRAVALAFAREGADVVISCLPSEEKDAQDTAQLIQDAGCRAVTVPADLTNEEQCQRLVDRAVQEFGRIDILVNSAGYQMVQMGASKTSPLSSSTVSSRPTCTPYSGCRSGRPGLAEST